MKGGGSAQAARASRTEGARGCRRIRRAVGVSFAASQPAQAFVDAPGFSPFTPARETKYFSSATTRITLRSAPSPTFPGRAARQLSSMRHPTGLKVLHTGVQRDIKRHTAPGQTLHATNQQKLRTEGNVGCNEQMRPQSHVDRILIPR